MLNKSVITGSHALQTVVVAALIHAECDRPIAAFQELDTVDHEQVVRLVVNHSDDLKELAKALERL